MLMSPRRPKGVGSMKPESWGIDARIKNSLHTSYSLKFFTGGLYRGLHMGFYSGLVWGL